MIPFALGTIDVGLSRASFMSAGKRFGLFPISPSAADLHSLYSFFFQLPIWVGFGQIPRLPLLRRRFHMRLQVHLLQFVSPPLFEPDQD